MTREQADTIAAMNPAAADLEAARVFSADVYLPRGDDVLRVDPSGRTTPAAAMPSRGVTLAQDATSSAVVAATLHRMT
jgi:hypothetical protein